jgi:hypoxanthine phosphoribosyltransferase
MSDFATHVEVLISQADLAERVRALGQEITRAHAGKPLVVVGVLKGSFIFLADLVRAIDLPLSVDFIGISSYQGTSSTGVVQITSDLTRPIEGKDVLLVEDIRLRTPPSCLGWWPQRSFTRVWCNKGAGCSRRGISCS